MGLIQRIFGRTNERRSAGSNYTAQLIAARSNYLAGTSGLAELTSTAQACIGLWEGGFAMADVSGTDLLNRASLALVARSLAIRGEAVLYFGDDCLQAASDWSLTTDCGAPTAYRLSLPEAQGDVTRTALAGEVLHFRIGCDTSTPWAGSSPLRRASLTAGMLDALETALVEIYGTAPLGSQIVPFPESKETDLTSLGASFRATRGRVLLRESVNVTAAGGPGPMQDWAPVNVTPDLSRALLAESLDAARNGICTAFGVLPSLFVAAAQGPLVREAQRHLAAWTLQPIAELMAEECRAKLGADVSIDVIRPLQAQDTGGRARALQMLVQTMADAKAAGLPDDAFAAAVKAVNFGGGDELA